jgi:membrane-associated protease RseP (regulator of RpoE activity)
MTMRKHILTSVVLLPLLFSFSHAAQTRPADPPEQSFVFSSEDSGSSAYLGVDIADVTSERVSALKLKEEKGVEVTMVDQDAPAGKAGIKEHDVILTMNGTTVESAAQLRRMIHETPAGRVITLGLSRDGGPVTVKVQLADRHKEFSTEYPKGKEFHFEIPEIHVPEIDIPSISVVMISSARSGLTVECITPQLGEYFGVKNGNGVLVRNVEKGSRAEKAGFRAGDVIVKINDQPVHDTSDFSHAVRSRKGGSLTVGVVRDKKELNLNLTLPGHRESGDLLEEESFDEPMVEAESALEMSELQNEVAKLGPQTELAAQSALKSAEQLRQSLCEQQKKFRQQTRAQGEQLRREQERLKREMERMSRELRGNGLDI